MIVRRRRARTGSRGSRFLAARVALIAAVGLVAACTSGGGGDKETSSSRSTTTTASTAPLRVVTLNVLHGLFCPPETDSCQAPDRAAMIATAIEDAGCPELVGLQEVGPRQEELFPSAFDRVCSGRYEVVWSRAGGPDQAMVLTTLPITDQAHVDLAAFPWEAYWVRVDAPLGPVDFLTTHFASSVNNPPCTAETCPPSCAAGIETNQCNAIEVVEFLAARAPGAMLQVASGDFNAPPGDPTLLTFADASFLDAWLEAGNEECDPGTGTGCTSDRVVPDTPLDGLELSEGRYSERIDFVLVRRESCDLDVEAEAFVAEPLANAYRGLFWPSDHAGVLAELSCR